MARHERDSTRNVAGVNVVLDHLVNALQTLARESEILGFGRFGKRGSGEGQGNQGKKQKTAHHLLTPLANPRPGGLVEVYIRLGWRFVDQCADPIHLRQSYSATL